MIGFLFVVATTFALSPAEGTADCLRCHQTLGDHPSPPPLLAQPSGSRECRECHSDAREITLAVVSNTEPARPSVEVGEETVQEMIFIPAGEFLMGNNGRVPAFGPGDADERPLHKVSVEGFSIDRYEVTNASYKTFVEATGHRPPPHWKEGHYPAGKANHPVVYVDWHDARDFCRWAGKRLPTEAEWEKAARGTDERSFPWGNVFDATKANTPQHWLKKGTKAGSLPVGSFPDGLSSYGVSDMAGNVYEWTADWYQPYPGNTTPNIHYGRKNKVLRGGSWYDCLSYGCGLSSPVYNRSRFAPEIRNAHFGFRCARSQ